ncbi:hypothetical protein [Desulfotruncus alcoholivorax]|uniref:hypothetical protein n=1 Tax=Desulfotruncus alcoholivorax TaxID=265477 RepID=UPI0012FECD08|nr:hypothetical protein [Desulfotruncus alcoholivorax]
MGRAWGVLTVDPEQAGSLLTAYEKAGIPALPLSEKWYHGRRGAAGLKTTVGNKTCCRRGWIAFGKLSLGHWLKVRC